MYRDGVVTIAIEDKHITDKKKIQPLHRRWTISDAGEMSPVFEGPEKAMIIALAEKIRIRVKREGEEEAEKQKEIESLSTALLILMDNQGFYEEE